MHLFNFIRKYPYVSVTVHLLSAFRWSTLCFSRWTFTSTFTTTTLKALSCIFFLRSLWFSTSAAASSLLTTASFLGIFQCITIKTIMAKYFCMKYISSKTGTGNLRFLFLIYQSSNSLRNVQFGCFAR